MQAKSLQDTLPASDKSFSRFLGEVPLLPDSALKLLEDLCRSGGFDNLGKDVRDGEHVTQSLGADEAFNVLSLSLPPYHPLKPLICFSLMVLYFNCSALFIHNTTCVQRLSIW